jgi:hypothetical protein
MLKWTGIKKIALGALLLLPRYASAATDPALIPASMDDAKLTSDAGTQGDFQPADALYAPEDITYSAGTQAQAPAPQESASYYSQAKIVACDFGHGNRPLEGAEIFIEGQYVGKSPLSLTRFLIEKPEINMTARLEGYDEALRPAMHLPAEGEARIYLVGTNAASWYTVPSMVLGVLALGGSVAAYAQAQRHPGSSQLGLGLVLGGTGIIALSQIIAHGLHLPALSKRMQELNSKPEAQPEAKP